MNDLASLMEFAPLVAASYMGQNQSRERRMDDFRQQELAQLIATRTADAQQKAQMHPYELEKARLGNEKSQAELPKLLAEAQLKKLEQQKAEGTIDTDIQLGNFKNQDEMYKSFLTGAGTLGKQMESLPATQRPLFMAEQLRQQGYPQVEQLMQRFSHVTPEQLPKYLTSLSDQHLRSNPSYAQHMDTTIQQGRNSENVARIQADATVTAAKERGKRGLSGDLREDVISELSRAKGAKNKMAVLVTGITKANAANDFELANELRAQAMALKPAYDQEVNSARAGGVDINAQTGGRVPVNPGSDIPIPEVGNQPTPPATNTAGGPKPHTLAEVSKMYPGVPPEKLREVYKKKFGVDLK